MALTQGIAVTRSADDVRTRCMRIADAYSVQAQCVDALSGVGIKQIRPSVEESVMPPPDP